MGVPKRLTEMQQRFAEFLVFGDENGPVTKTEAALRAGYSPKRLREAALKKGSFSSAVNAEANRGKAAGLYIDRKIIKTGKLEDLSEKELENKMKQILEDYEPILNAKQIEGEVISSESSSPIDEES